MNLRRILALFTKEVQDLRRNTSIISMLLVPPLMTFLWSGLMKLPADSAYTIGTLFAVVMVGVYSPAMMFAEEKEKHTLRVLMLSPATPLEIILSKGLVTFLVIVLVSALLIPISTVAVQSIGLLALILLLGGVFVILLGFIIGLLSPNQMATGYIGMPIYLLLLLVPILGQQVPVLKTLAKLVPTSAVGDGVYKAVQGRSLLAAQTEVTTLAIAGVIALVVFLVMYRRQELKD